MAYFKMIRIINEKIEYWENYKPKNYFTKCWTSIQIEKLNNKKEKLQSKFNRLKYKSNGK